MKTIRITLTAVSIIFLSLSLFGQLPQIDCSLVDPRNPNHDSFFPICDLNVLDGYTGVMSNIITGAGPTPLCDNGGAPHNITWFSFIAPDGEYSIVLTPYNCTDANGEPPGTGIQTGIYSDCTFSEQVGPCIGIPCSQAPLEVHNIDPVTGEQILIPGQIYYWFTDGCSGTVCELEITISGNAIPFSQDTDGELDFRVLDNLSFTAYRANYFGEITNSGDFYWSVEPSTYETLNGSISGNSIHTQENFLDLNFLENQTYTVCLDSIVSKCAFTTTSICSEFTSINGLVSGISFWDINENGILDTSEYRLPNARVKSGTKSVFTDEMGEYTLPVNAGSVSINAGLPYSSWKENPIQIDTFLGTTDLDSINFPFQVDEEDLKIITSIPTLRTRCNSESSVNAIIFNPNYLPVSVLAYIELDDCLTYVSSEPMTDSIVGNRYYFSTDILPGGKFVPSVTANNPGVEKVGELVTIDAFAEVISTGNQSSSTRTQVYRCAYDPNDKTVSPDRDGDENWTLRDERLDYHIRFQNNGNDTAFHVRIVDVINPNIDLNTLLLLDNSHPVTITTNEDSLFFDFYGIELVDSMTNFEGSQGFVTFSVETVDGIPENTVIQNTAGIYFDLNPPIITNTVQNTIVTFLPCAPVTITIDTTICREDGFVDYLGYTQSGNYIDTFNLFDNCDSIRILNLNIEEETYSDVVVYEICDGDVIIIEGTQYDQDGDFQIVVGKNVSGCDSIVQFSVNTNLPAFTILPDILICEGDSIVLNGDTITLPGSYTLDAGQTTLGCDSSVFIKVDYDSNTFCNASCESVSNEFLVDQCDKTLAFCNLNDLDSICFTMLEEVTGNGPDPICSSGGVVHNISWIAFVAGEGDYSIKVTPENCTPGEADLKGISFGIYTDCTFSEEVFCMGFPTAEDPIEVPSKNTDDGYLLTPGETYYLFIDGAAGSVCDIQMEVLGDFIPFDAQIRTEDLVCEFKDGIGNCIDTLFTGTEIRITSGTASVETKWIITRLAGPFVPNSWTSSGVLNAGRITTDSNFIDVTFLEAGEFNIVWIGSDHTCYATQVTFPSKGVVVKRSVANINQINNPILQVFPNPTKEQVTYTLNHAQTSTYKLISLQGELMLSGKGNTRQVEVDLKELPQGTYLLEVETNQGDFGVQKVVKL